MKELSIEEKAERYDEVIEGIQEILSTGEDSIKMSRLQLRLQGILPELKENADEKIRKNLITFLKEEYGTNSSAYFAGIKVKEIIAWLEKQGEKKPFNYESANIQQKDFAPKVEPKFKVGDWVVNKLGVSWHIDSFDKKNYQVSDGKGHYNYFSISKQDEMHLWTIKDAKDGDVLVVPPIKGSEHSEQIFIFKEIKDRLYVKNAVEYYCRYMDNEFAVNKVGYMGTASERFYPATKEQRDTLFNAMADAGYEFDFEKRKLKNIE